MTNDLSPVANGVADLPSVLVSNDIESARRYVDASTAASTRRAYASDWAIYRAWCTARGYEPLPSSPEQVALFLAHEANRRLAVSTVERRLAAIGFFHRARRYPAPTAMEEAAVIQTTMRGIRRQIGAAKRKKRPATDDLVRRMLDAIPEIGLRNLRDRALLAFGLASAMRRSELVAVEVGHLTRTDDGVEIIIPRSKPTRMVKVKSSPSHAGCGFAPWRHWTLGCGPPTSMRAPSSAACAGAAKCWIEH